MTVSHRVYDLQFGSMLQGKIALVTAAGSGIGRASAIAMARQGAHVVVTDLDGCKAAEVAHILTSEGLSATSLMIDVTDDAALSAAIDGAVKHLVG